MILQGFLQRSKPGFRVSYPLHAVKTNEEPTLFLKTTLWCSISVADFRSHRGISHLGGGNMLVMF